MTFSAQLSTILVEWTTALVDNDITLVQKFLLKEPELLWTPIPQSLDNLDHLEQRLAESKKLGSTFQPVSAIQFTCLYINQDDQLKLIAYLIEQSSLHDLDTRFWGECNNSTLHLACFLENKPIMRLLLEKGVSATPANDLGYLPSDIAAADIILHYLDQQKQQQSSRSKAVRPNYGTPNKFKLLKELAEETTNSGGDDHKTLEISLDRQKSDGRLFRKGRVKETQQKVLAEEAELEKQRLKRQMEVAQLAKKSAVKNNPLFMKLEKKFGPANKATGEIASKHINARMEQAIAKRNSSVISSLKVKSYVSSSIFLQADEDATIEQKLPPPPIPPAATITTTDSHKTDDQQDENSNNEVCATTPPLNVNKTQTLIGSTEPDELLVDGQFAISDNPVLKDHETLTEEEDEESSEDEDEFDEQQDFDSSTNNLSSSSSLTVTSKINYSPIENKTVYPDIQSYYQYNKTSANACHQNQHRELDHSIAETDEEEEEEQESGESGESEENEESEEQEEDEEEDEEIVPVQFATRLATPIYKSVTILNEDQRVAPVTTTISTINPSKTDNGCTAVPNEIDTIHENQEMVLDDLKIEEAQNFTSHSAAAVVDTPFVEPPESSPPVPPLRSRESAIAVLKKLEKQDSREMKRRSGSQKASWTMSMSSWAAILDREFNLEELDQEKKLKEMQRFRQSVAESEEKGSSASPDHCKVDGLGLANRNMDMDPTEAQVGRSNPTEISLDFSNFETPAIPTVSVQKSISTNTSAPQIGEIPRLNASKSVRRKPITSSLSEPNLQQQQRPASSVKQYNITLSQATVKKAGYGRLYLHVNGIQDILLPLPKDRAYVRCVVSDGRFEYMSRYEILSQNINYDYECVIDTHPDMIITISLHVRPDYIMKSRTPFSRLFSKKKKKECLSGYVNKEDGAIGQARFALTHMLPVCQHNSYLAGFHCFNAWYSRSFKERHRQKKKKRDSDRDVLKVVGNFDIEMLYLPAENYSQKPFPQSLRECDQIIKQLHESKSSSSTRYQTI
ncbi:hypothetical protein BD408DRAFT_367978 [Parasitella parasitica]|nr:hypothetical protein BD408DRAFT_367978 [Parasitella parasitica]